MQISKLNDYALRAMIAIALHQKKGPLPIEKLAVQLNISPSYVGQLISKLRKYFLIEAKQGRRGGYVINSNLENISMLQIITAISITKESKKDIKKERKNSAKKGKKDGLFTLPVWSQLSRHVSQFLKEITLQDLVEQAIQEQAIETGMKNEEK